MFLLSTYIAGLLILVFYIVVVKRHDKVLIGYALILLIWHAIDISLPLFWKNSLIWQTTAAYMACFASLMLLRVTLIHTHTFPPHYPLYYGFLVPALTGIYFYQPWHQPTYLNAIPKIGLITSLTIYTLLVLLASLFVTISHALKNPIKNQKNALRLLLTILPPIAIDLKYIALKTGLPQPEHILLAFEFSTIFLYGLSRRSGNQLYRLGLDRADLIEKSSLAWLILSQDHRIYDANQQAADLFGTPLKQLYDLPITRFIENWDEYIVASTVRARIQIPIGEQIHYWQTRVEPIQLSDDEHCYLVTLEDITEEQIQREKQQKLRAEMFSLLYTLSSRINEAESLEEFIELSLLQLAYTYRSQTGAIYLNENILQNMQSNKFVLTAFTQQDDFWTKKLAVLPINDPVIMDIWDKDQPVLLHKGAQRPGSSICFDGLDVNEILLVPLRHGEKLIGLTILARSPDARAYTAEEAHQLNLIGAEIANLVMQRQTSQMSLVLFERQRLMRALHDSVMQNIYALMKFAEAASDECQPPKAAKARMLLGKILQAAQQAIREMRLAIFELKPLELEEKGLVEVLRERLLSVEGDVRLTYKICAEENLSLTPEQEKTFYLIAQEALNNILRHAQATRIIIRLRRVKKHVIMHIADNGKGFDRQHTLSHHQGIKNMEERAYLAGGKVRLFSRPEQGCHVVASLPTIRISDQREE